MMTHNNNEETKLANAAHTGGVPINLTRLDVTQKPKHPLPPMVTAQKYGLTKQDLL